MLLLSFQLFHVYINPRQHSTRTVNLCCHVNTRLYQLLVSSPSTKVICDYQALLESIYTGKGLNQNLIDSSMLFQLTIIFQFSGHEYAIIYLIINSCVLNQNQIVDWNNMKEYIKFHKWIVPVVLNTFVIYSNLQAILFLH